MGKHPLASRIWALMYRVVPVRRIAASQECVPCHHPRPDHHPHVLVVPTRPFPSLASDAVPDPRKQEIVGDMVRFARETASCIDSTASWRLVINGGTRQEIGQVHGHLITAEPGAVSDGIPLGDPATVRHGWPQLWSAISSAPSIPHTEYAVIISLIGEGTHIARIAQ